jgi:hypothetical protein
VARYINRVPEDGGDNRIESARPVRLVLEAVVAQVTPPVEETVRVARSKPLVSEVAVAGRRPETQQMAERNE